jgi:excisionase family DNA binding protein
MKGSVGRKNLTSRQAARLLGVSEASVKRWADSGLLPALKTAGGHRRFRPEDLAAFRRAAPGRDAAERPRPDAAPAPLDARLSDELFELIVGGHEDEAASVLVGLHLQGHTVARLADVLLCPALRRVGELWHAGRMSVAQEHLATRTTDAALGSLRAAARVRTESAERVAVCCAVEDDYHELPVNLAALTLEARGWEVVNLGMSTPFYALAEAVARFVPRLVCVASTVFRQTDRAAREYGEFVAALKSAGASVVLGGAGFQGEGVRQRFPADLYAATFSELEEHAAALAREAGAGR